MEQLTDSLAIKQAIEKLAEIISQTSSVAYNTSPNFWLDDWSLIAIISTGLTFIGLGSLFLQSRQTRIDNQCQKLIFIGILRHLYRSKICAIVMRLKYEQAFAEAGKFCYPSDEHYLKLLVLPDDLHLENFYRNQDRFDILHHIHLLMRNYNTEVETSLQHIKDVLVPQDSKMRDFKTLSYKCGLITSEILNAVQVIWPKENNANILWCEIEKSHSDNIKGNPLEKIENIENIESIIDRFIADYCATDNYINSVVADDKREYFLSILRQDLIIELGYDSKIHIIYPLV